MRRPRSLYNYYEVLLVITVFSIVVILSNLYQKRISFNSGQGWDGVEYFSMAYQFSHGQLPRANGPFVYRIGTPFLASLLSTCNLLDAFFIVNMIANAVTVFLLYVFFRMQIPDWKIRVILIAMFMLQWHAPLRFAFYYPAYSDPYSFVFMLAGLILLTKYKANFTIGYAFLLGVIVFLGVLFRETVIMVALSVPFITNPMDVNIIKWNGLKKNVGALRISVFLPMLFGVFGISLTHILATKTNGYSFILSATYWAYMKPFLSYILSWFISYGPILAILLYGIKDCWVFLIREQHLLILLSGFVVLAWLGGADTERMLYWSFPIVYVLIGRVICAKSELLRSFPIIIILSGLQAISERILWPIPDFPNLYSHKFPILTPAGKQFPYLDLYAYHGVYLIESISLLQYVLCVGGLLLWSHNRFIKLTIVKSPELTGGKSIR